MIKTNVQTNCHSLMRNFYIIILKYLQSSKIVTKILFGVTPFPKYRVQHWDLTTLVLKKALKMFVQDDQNVLEIGTSDLAILSIYIAKKNKLLDITAVDINSDFVENARRNAKNNNVEIKIFESNLFSHVRSSFDIIFFNPPYVPTHCGSQYEELEAEINIPPEKTNIYSKVWDGGDDGLDIIRRFLHEASQRISMTGIILLGVNMYFIKHEKIIDVVKSNNLRIISTVSSILSPSKVFILSM